MIKTWMFTNNVSGCILRIFLGYFLNFVWANEIVSDDHSVDQDLYYTSHIL